jgi:hypothetical protein
MSVYNGQAAIRQTCGLRLAVLAPAAPPAQGDEPGEKRQQARNQPFHRRTIGKSQQVDFVGLPTGGPALRVMLKPHPNKVRRLG